MRKILLTLLTTLLCSVTAWGATAKTSIGTLNSNVTGTAANKKFTTYFSGSSGVVGNIYASRNGSGIAIFASGTQINGAVNFVFQTSGVYAISLKLLQQAANKSPFTLYLASITDDAYSKVLSSQSNNVNYEDKTNGGNWSNLQITTGSAVKRAFSFDVDDYASAAYTGTITAVPAGKYTIYFSGNNYVYVQDITFTPAVMYDKNGGTGTAMSATVAVPTSDITIATNTYTAPAGKQFKEWNTQADGEGTSYAAGATTSTGLYLYAIWEDAGGGSCTATANAGADKNTTVNTGVALAATAAGDGKTGAWTVQSAPDGATGDYAPTFSSTSSATATFTPKVKGSYTLRWTVTCTEGESSANDDMEVSVCAPITPTFSTDYTSTTLTVGGGTSSTPVVNKNGSSGAITWTSSAPAKATVNSSGVVTPVAAGSATITATVTANGDYCEGSVSKNFTINAAACSPSISFSPASANYCKDDVATALSFTGSGHNAQKWQKSTDSGSSWSDIDGATNATYTPSTSATGSTQYRVVTTCDSYTTTATSSAATVTVKTSPGLTITLN